MKCTCPQGVVKSQGEEVGRQVLFW